MSIHILDILHSHHADRAAHRQLEQEIADYQSEAERLDLEATLDRYSDEDSREIRQILALHAA
ncbi:MAG TPA: hypothetical protein VIC62_11100 [Nakamurella sp.]|jgi:hypothetical protein